MKNKKQKCGIVGLVFLLLLLSSCIGFHFDSIQVGIVTVFFSCLLLVSLYVTNFLVKKTSWYFNIFYVPMMDRFPTNLTYRRDMNRNYDIVSLGSSGAFFAYDFSKENLKGLNWGTAPQRIEDSLKILNGCHSILKKNAIVLLNLMLFSSLQTNYSLEADYRYYNLVPHSQIQAPRRFRFLKKYPLFVYPYKAIKAIIKMLLGRDIKDNRFLIAQNPMTVAALQQDALHWIESWEKQFGIYDLNKPLSNVLAAGVSVSVNQLIQIIDFCKARDYTPVIVVPPVSIYLNQLLPTNFRKNYIDDFLKKIKIQRPVHMLDYSSDQNWSNPDFYFNSFFLNAKGRALFTHQVLNDVSLLL